MQTEEEFIISYKNIFVFIVQMFNQPAFPEIKYNQYNWNGQGYQTKEM